MSAGDDLLQQATDVRTDAVRHLTALAGDASMCAMGLDTGLPVEISRRQASSSAFM